MLDEALDLNIPPEIPPPKQNPLREISALLRTAALMRVKLISK